MCLIQDLPREIITLLLTLLLYYTLSLICFRVSIKRNQIIFGPLIYSSHFERVSRWE